MEFRETLARRHSSRAYEATPVSDEALDTILAAGRERRGGDDDCAVLALYRDKDGGAVEV